jgi:hypothetical protein
MGWFTKEEAKGVVLRSGSDLTCLVCKHERFLLRRPWLNLGWSPPPHIMVQLVHRYHRMR